jgi:hypothetical protein
MSEKIDRRHHWMIQQEKSIKEYQETEKKAKAHPDNNRDIDMGGGCRTENDDVSNWDKY